MNEVGRSELVPDAAASSFRRPASGEWGFGVRLRRVIGVREDIMDWVPEERPRYTRLGAIVVNTGLMAGISLMVALHSFTSVPWILLLPAVVFWGFVIIVFDGWLIASTHGKANASRLWIFVPRLVISALFGVVIAEPLLLLVFQPAIHKQVLDTRRNEIDHYTDRLTACNPASGAVVKTPDCAGFRVTVDGSPQAAQGELDQTTAERDARQRQLAADAGKLSSLQSFANAECAGTGGPGLTGHAGDGPECLRDRAVADQFRSDSGLDRRQAELTALDNKVATLTTALATAQSTYRGKLTGAIDARVQGKRADQGSIGILDEEDGLATLSSVHPGLFVDQWMVRLLLIAVDCLPALAKAMSGVTAYDKEFAHQLEVGRRDHEREMDEQDRKRSAGSEQRLRKIDHDLDVGLRRIDDDDRDDQADRAVAKQTRISSLAARLRDRGVAG